MEAERNVGEERVVELYGTRFRGCTLDSLIEESLDCIGETYRLAILEYMLAFCNGKSVYYSEKHGIAIQFFSPSFPQTMRLMDLPHLGYGSRVAKPFQPRESVYRNQMWLYPYKTVNCSMVMTRVSPEEFEKCGKALRDFYKIRR